MKGDIRILQDELRAMAARQDSLVSQLRIEAIQTQDTLRTQGDQMFDFRGDINRHLQQMQQSLVRLEAIAGENQRGMAAIRDQLANLRRTQGGMGTAPAGGPGTGSTGVAGSESLIGSGGGNADELWTVATDMRARGSLNAASQAYDQFIADYPDDPRVPDAHYNRADVLEQQNRPDDALEAFQGIQELFPTSPRVPEALFRVAALQESMGDTAAAKATLERIVNTYPDAFVAELARARLRELG